MNMHLIKMTYVYSMMTIITLGVIIMGVWYVFPERPVTIVGDQNAIAVDKPVYDAGERITYTFSYCADRSIAATVSRAIVDQVRTTFVDVPNSVLEKGCHTVSVNSLIIPDYLPSDTYHLTIDAVRQVNPIKKVTTSLKTVDFQVVNQSNDATQLKNHEAQDQLKFDQLRK